MSFESYEKVLHILVFLVPGFLLHSASGIFIRRQIEEVQLTLLRLLTYSIINYALWVWLIFLIVRFNLSETHPIWAAFAWTFVILIGPFGLGILLGHYRQTGTVNRFFQRLGLNPMHPIPTSWDYKFIQARKPEWVIVTLKDGSQVAGFFGYESFVSSEPNERDVLLEEVYKIQDDQWLKVDRTAGILIPAGEIRHIEFFDPLEEDEHGNQ